MLAWVLLVANMPAIVPSCARFARPSWLTRNGRNGSGFAGLAVLAGIGGLLTLSVVHAQQLSFAWRA
jgi:hypothetical protein